MKNLTMNQEQLMGLIRHSLNILGTILVVKGVIDEANWVVITGSITGIVAIIWSMLAKSPTVTNFVKANFKKN